MAQVQAAVAPPGLSFGEKVVVLMGGIIAAMALTVLNPVLPVIEKELAHSATDQMLVKQLFGATTLAMVLGAPLGGFLVGRLGMRRMLLAASLVYAISGTAGLYLSSLPMLLVSRLFVGASAACIQVMSLTLVNTRLDPQGRAKWMGLHVAIAVFCSLIVLPAAGLLGDVSWRLPFLLYLIGLAVFAALLFSRESDTPQAPAANATTSEAITGPSIWNWMPWHYVLLSMLVGAITFLPTIYSPYLFRERSGLGPSGIAAVMTATALIGGISALLYSKARRYLSIHMAFVAAFGMAAVGMLIVALAGSLPVMLVGFFIYSTGNSWFVPNVMTSLGGKVQPWQQSRAAGLVKAGHFISTPVSVIVIEPYARQFGAQTVMLAACVMSTVVVVLVLGRMVALGKTSLAVTGAPAAGH
jgi:MFS family permease